MPLVWSSDKGSVCPRCGWPAVDCRCSRPAEEKVPARPTAKLRIEKQGRGGKSVTVLDGLPRNAAFLDALAKELKKACGTGGTVKDGTIELQGDRRDAIRALLGARNFVVKG